jgi:hypothetical protein
VVLAQATLNLFAVIGGLTIKRFFGLLSLLAALLLSAAPA